MLSHTHLCVTNSILRAPAIVGLCCLMNLLAINYVGVIIAGFKNVFPRLQSLVNTSSPHF